MLEQRQIMAVLLCFLLHVGVALCRLDGLTSLTRLTHVVFACSDVCLVLCVFVRVSERRWRRSTGPSVIWNT